MASFPNAHGLSSKQRNHEAPNAWNASTNVANFAFNSSNLANLTSNSSNLAINAPTPMEVESAHWNLAVNAPINLPRSLQLNSANFSQNAVPQALEQSKSEETAGLQNVSLQQLRQQNQAAVETTFKALQRRGFIWLSFEENDALITAATPALTAANAFLERNQGMGVAHAMEGHFSAAHKDGVRIITGKWLTERKDKSLVEARGHVPDRFNELLGQMAGAFDYTQLEVARALAPKATGRSDGALGLGSICNIPLLCQHEHNLPSYALLDVVRYRMGPDSPQEVVSSHQDPGLFVLSLPSSAPGLQLQDEHGTWQAPPDGCGVLWVGEAGRKVRLRPAFHRVVATPDGAPRLSVWHELCTRAQLAPPLFSLLESANLELKLGNVRGTDEVLKLLQDAEDHKSSHLTQLTGTRNIPSVRKVQLAHRHGVPVGKSGIHINIEFEPLRAESMNEIGNNFFGAGDSSFQERLESAAPPPGVVEIVRKAGFQVPRFF